jgi:hypothetical protein
MVAQQNYTLKLTLEEANRVRLALETLAEGYAGPPREGEHPKDRLERQRQWQATEDLLKRM